MLGFRCLFFCSRPCGGDVAWKTRYKRVSYIDVFFTMGGTNPNPYKIPIGVPPDVVTGVKWMKNTIMCILVTTL